MVLLDTEKTNDAPASLSWECPYHSWRMLNTETGERREFDCKNWRCLKHGPMLAWRWGLRVGAIPWELMVTFTNVPEDQLLARRGWQAIMKYLRKQGITGFVKAMELGSQTGMRHYHVLLVGTPRVNLAALNAICEFHGHGFVWATKVKNKTRAAKYILKYPFKDLGAHSTRFRGWRTVTASRSVPCWQDVTRKFRGESFTEEGWKLCRE